MLAPNSSKLRSPIPSESSPSLCLIKSCFRERAHIISFKFYTLAVRSRRDRAGSFPMCPSRFCSSSKNRGSKSTAAEGVRVDGSEVFCDLLAAIYDDRPGCTFHLRHGARRRRCRACRSPAPYVVDCRGRWRMGAGACSCLCCGYHRGAGGAGGVWEGCCGGAGTAHKTLGAASIARCLRSDGVKRDSETVSLFYGNPNRHVTRTLFLGMQCKRRNGTANGI